MPRDPHDLALRGRHLRKITQLIHERIVEAVDLRSGDDLVDLGCGDGTLLRLAELAGARTAVGLLATEEEVAVLRRAGLTLNRDSPTSCPSQTKAPRLSSATTCCSWFPGRRFPRACARSTELPNRAHASSWGRFLLSKRKIRLRSSAAGENCSLSFITSVA